MTILGCYYVLSMYTLGDIVSMPCIFRSYLGGHCLYAMYFQELPWGTLSLCHVFSGATLGDIVSMPCIFRSYLGGHCLYAIYVEYIQLNIVHKYENYITKLPDTSAFLISEI